MSGNYIRKPNWSFITEFGNALYGQFDKLHELGYSDKKNRFHETTNITFKRDGSRERKVGLFETLLNKKQIKLSSTKGNSNKPSILVVGRMKIPTGTDADHFVDIGYRDNPIHNVTREACVLFITGALEDVEFDNTSLRKVEYMYDVINRLTDSDLDSVIWGTSYTIVDNVDDYKHMLNESGLVYDDSDYDSYFPFFMKEYRSNLSLIERTETFIMNSPAAESWKYQVQNILYVLRSIVIRHAHVRLGICAKIRAYSKYYIED